MHLPLPSNGMGELHSNSSGAFELHKYFVSSQLVRDRFFILDPDFYEIDYTINVNFIAFRGDQFNTTWDMIQQLLLKEHRYYDEGAITWYAKLWAKKRLGIFMPLVVAHASYSWQTKFADEILVLYAELAKKEKQPL